MSLKLVDLLVEEDFPGGQQIRAFLLDTSSFERRRTEVQRTIDVNGSVTNESQNKSRQVQIEADWAVMQREYATRLLRSLNQATRTFFSPAFFKDLFRRLCARPVRSAAALRTRPIADRLAGEGKMEEAVRCLVENATCQGVPLVAGTDAHSWLN